MAGQLTVRGGAYRGMVLALGEGVTSIGRETDNTLVLLEEGISRHHAAIRWDGKQYLLEDLGSKNGTWLNGTRLAAPEPLSHGDVITLPALPPLELMVALNVEPVAVPPTVVRVLPQAVPAAYPGGELRIEIDEERRDQDVRKIVESEEFQDLAERAKAIRKRSHRAPRPPSDAAHGA